MVYPLSGFCMLAIWEIIEIAFCVNTNFMNKSWDLEYLLSVKLLKYKISIIYFIPYLRDVEVAICSEMTRRIRIF